MTLRFFLAVENKSAPSVSGKPFSLFFFLEIIVTPLFQHPCLSLPISLRLLERHAREGPLLSCACALDRTFVPFLRTFVPFLRTFVPFLRIFVQVRRTFVPCISLSRFDIPLSRFDIPLLLFRCCHVFHYQTLTVLHSRSLIVHTFTTFLTLLADIVPSAFLVTFDPVAWL